MLEIRLYHHEITQRERQLIRAAQAGRTITWLGRKYRPLRVDQIAEPGKHRTELCFGPVGFASHPQLALTPENLRELSGLDDNDYQKQCQKIWQRNGMSGDGEFVLVHTAGLPVCLTIKGADHV